MATAQEIVEWEKEVRSAGGYRKYYEEGKQGTTLQGCNTPGGLGIDCEFFESSLLPSIFVYGFMGIILKADKLEINPKLPSHINNLTVKNIKYRNWVLNITATHSDLNVEVVSQIPQLPIKIKYIQKPLSGEMKETEKLISDVGVYTFN